VYGGCRSVGQFADSCPAYCTGSRYVLTFSTPAVYLNFFSHLFGRVLQQIFPSVCLSVTCVLWPNGSFSHLCISWYVPAGMLLTIITCFRRSRRYLQGFCHTEGYLAYFFPVASKVNYIYECLQGVQWLSQGSCHTVFHY